MRAAGGQGGSWLLAAAAGCSNQSAPRPPTHRYRAYLQSVAEAGFACQEVGDILARQALLQAANDDLRTQTEAAGAEADAVRAAAGAHTRSRSAVILSLSSRLAGLKREVEAARAEAAALEAEHEHGQRLAAARALEAWQVKAAASCAYQRVLQRSRVARACEEVDPAAQLGAVACYLGDLRAALAAQQGTGAGEAPHGSD